MVMKIHIFLCNTFYISDYRWSDDRPGVLRVLTLPHVLVFLPERNERSIFLALYSLHCYGHVSSCRHAVRFLW